MTTEFAPRSRRPAGALERDKLGNDSPWSWPHFESDSLLIGSELIGGGAARSGCSKSKLLRFTEFIYGFRLLVETPRKKVSHLYGPLVPLFAPFPFSPSSNMSGRGRGRGKGGRGRTGGRGKRKKRKKPSSSAAERTEDDDSSIELVVPPSRPSNSPSKSSTDGEKKRSYRKFDADDATFRNTLLDQAARHRIKAMQDNPKNPGRLPRGFGAKQVEAFKQKVPNLRITESDIDNRRRLIAAKSKKSHADAQEERMSTARSIADTASSASSNITATILDDANGLA